MFANTIRKPFAGKPMEIGDIDFERILFIGIGNRDKGDDAIGPVMIDYLMTKGFPNVIDAGTVPENYTGQILQYSPQTLLVFDAVDFGGKPGEWKLFQPEELAGDGFSTHNASLSLFCSYIEQSIPVRIVILGMQPMTLEFEKGLSPAVAEATEKLIRVLNRHFNN